MPKINVLPFAVANLIAAGEVVDRPASVVKELMENSIDAGAKNITVEIQNGGVALIRVTDDGCGMTAEDLALSIRRHATSKIREAKDLDGISSLGFRGEALAAIASVSDLCIITRVRGAELGAVLEAEGGNVISLTERGCSEGTTVLVEHLFANVPARRKFLKRDVTEAMAVAANVEKVAMSHPEIAVRMISDGDTKIETAGDGDLSHVAYAIYGKDFAARMLPVDHEEDGITLRGLIGRTDNFRANRNFENFFINGRYVKSKTASAALEQAYTSYMPPERFPCCILNIELNPARVDVNVHPAKLEVKFSDEKAIFEAVYYTVRNALQENQSRPAMQLPNGRLPRVPQRKPFVTAEELRNGSFNASRMSDRPVPVYDSTAGFIPPRQISYDLDGQLQPQPQVRMTAAEYQATYGKGKPTQRPISERDLEPPPQVVLPRTEPTEKPIPEEIPIPSVGQDVPIPPAPPAEPSETPAPIPAPPEEVSVGRESSAEIPTESSAPTPATPVESSAEPPRAPAYRIVGEVFYSYVIVEVGEKMLLVDKHAAHERILFEQLKAGLQSVETVSQMLMVPTEVMLTSGEVAALREFDPELQKIGFSLRFARNTVEVDAIPETLDVGAVSALLQTMAGRILDNTGSVKLTRDIVFEKALYQAACKAAIKAGREYADGHIEWIIRKLMEIPDITFCPHGRPVALELTKKNIDRQFDRTGF